MGRKRDKFTVEFSRKSLKNNCETNFIEHLFGIPFCCDGCSQTDRDLLICNLKYPAKYRIKER